MWFQRSPVLMHPTSLADVSFGRASHAADETAPAVAAGNSQAATHSGASHAGTNRRDLKGPPIEPSPTARLDGARRRPKPPPGAGARSSVLAAASYSHSCQKQLSGNTTDRFASAASDGSVRVSPRRSQADRRVTRPTRR